jgi:hypothetical protein
MMTNPHHLTESYDRLRGPNQTVTTCRRTRGFTAGSHQAGENAAGVQRLWSTEPGDRSSLGIVRERYPLTAQLLDQGFQVHAVMSPTTG